MSCQKIKICRQVHNGPRQSYLKNQTFKRERSAFAASTLFRAGGASHRSDSPAFHAPESYWLTNFWKAREMLRRQIRMPDVEPAIAQAEVTAPAPLHAALKTAGFSIGAIILCIVLSSGWSQLSKLGRGQQIDVSAAE
jgi:hypothetical protein